MIRFFSKDVSKIVATRLASFAEKPDMPVAVVTPEVAHDLIFEVGWESRHVFVDVRPPDEFGRGRPRTAINIPLDDKFDDTAREVIPVERVVVNSGTAAARLDELGYRAVVLEGGFEKWRDLGLPISVDGLDDDDDEDDGDPSKW